MNPSDPAASDDLFETVVAGVLRELPEPYLAAVEQVAVLVEDEPAPALLAELGLPPGEDLFGLYTGTALTERSVDTGFDLPPQVQIFRGPLKRYAQERSLETNTPAARVLAKEIRVTLLHELGHHFGLDEDQLDALGYG